MGAIVFERFVKPNILRQPTDEARLAELSRRTTRWTGKPSSATGQPCRRCSTTSSPSSRAIATACSRASASPTWRSARTSAGSRSRASSSTPERWPRTARYYAGAARAPVVQDRDGRSREEEAMQYALLFYNPPHTQIPASQREAMIGKMLEEMARVAGGAERAGVYRTGLRLAPVDTATSLRCARRRRARQRRPVRRDQGDPGRARRARVRRPRRGARLGAALPAHAGRHGRGAAGVGRDSR